MSVEKIEQILNLCHYQEYTDGDEVDITQGGILVQGYTKSVALNLFKIWFLFISGKLKLNQKKQAESETNIIQPLRYVFSEEKGEAAEVN